MGDYWKKQAEMFKGEMGALGRQGRNDFLDRVMGDLSGEKTAGTMGYPASQEVTDSFGGTFEQRMEEVKKANEQDKDASKSKGREMSD